MCDQCSKIFKTDKKHDPSVCPIALSLTCSCCKVKGHATLKCTNYHLWASRVPEYKEQLIPDFLRVHYKIPFDERTPITNVNLKPLPCPHKLADYAKKRMEHARNQIKGLQTLDIAESELYCSQCKPVMEIPEDKDGLHTANIRATLASHNLPNSSGKENKKLLESFAAMNGKTLVLKKYIQPVQKDDSPKIAEKPAPSPAMQENEPPKKKEIKLGKKSQTPGKAA
jgi:hypothetical protein